MNLLPQDENILLEAAARLTPQWLAGFFDGEGSVCCKVGHSGVSGVRVNLTQADPIMLSLVSLKFGGTGHIGQNSRKRGRVVYSIEWQGFDCLAVLEYIKDHVILKQRQVLAGLEIAKLTPLPGKKLRPDVKQRRNALASVITNANAHVGAVNQKEGCRHDG